MTTAEKIKNFFSKNSVGIIVIIVFLIFFFLLHWNSFNTPWERDEGEYAYSAWLMQQGQTPYVHSFVQKPPLIIYTYYLAGLIKPLALWPPRLLGFIFTLATCFLLALIAKKIYGNKAGWLALWISPLFLSFPPICALAANTEKFMLLPLTGLLALFVFRYRQEKKWTYFWAGVLSALAVLYKPIALPAAGLLIIYWLTSNWLARKNIRETLSALGHIFLGAILTLFLSLLYFIINGAAGELWQQVIVYNAGYAVDMRQYFPEFFFHYSKIFLNNWWTIFLLALSSIFFRPKFFVLWWILLLASLLFIINTQIGHYYLLLMPFLTLITVGAYSKLSPRIGIKEPIWENVLLATVIIFIMSVSFCSIGEQFSFRPDGLSTWIYGRENPFVESGLMADKIKENTKPEDKIFVAGSEPQLYYFSQRKSVSQFDITYPLAVATPWRLDYQRQVVKDLGQNEPTAIILSLRPTTGLWYQAAPREFLDYLLDELKENYRLAGGTALDSRNKAIWVEPDYIDRADMSLLLYLRK